MLKNIIFTFFILSLLISCTNRETGYRLVGKNGRVIYLEKKRPTFNEQKLKEKKQKTEDSNVKVMSNVGNNNKIVRVNEDNNIDKNLILDSNAYSLKSVVDTMVSNKDINAVARTIEKKQGPKTIRDFKIPDSYFNSKKIAESSDIMVNSPVDNYYINNNRLELNNSNNKKYVAKNTKKNSNINNKNVGEEKEKKPFFAGIFSRSRGNNLKVVSPNPVISGNTGSIVENSNTIIKKNNDIKKEFLSENNKNTSVKTVKKTNSNIAVKPNLSENNVIKQNEAIKNEFLNGGNGTKKTEVKNKTVKKIELNQNSDVKKIESKKTESDLEDIVKRNNAIKNEFLNDNKQISDKKTENNVFSLNKTPTKTPKTIDSSNILKNNKYYLQLGSFSNKKQAEKIISSFNSIGDERKVIPVLYENKQIYRAIIGSFDTKEKAEKEMEKIIEKGHFDVFVFKK